MANITYSSLLGGARVIVVDGNPASGGGTDMPVGTFAFVETGGIYTKTGVAATAWSTVSGAAAPTSITKAALAALISGNTVSTGTLYSITDAQDVISGETLVVPGTSSNTIGQGIWTKKTNLLPTGKFSILTGTSGSINTVTVNALNILSATVPFNTTRYQTALDVASNINAQTGTHNWKAYVIQGFTTTDIPTIVLEHQLKVATTFTLAVTATTLTVTASGNLVNPSNGAAETIIPLAAIYDVSADRIVYAKDQKSNNEVYCTPARITALTYNPVKTFWWGDTRLTGWIVDNTGFSNTWLLETAQMPNNIFTNCTFTNFAIYNIHSNKISNGTFSNVSSGGLFLIQSNELNCSSLTFSNITGGRPTVGTTRNSFTLNKITSVASGAAVTISITNIASGQGNALLIHNNSFNANVSISTSGVAPTSFIFTDNIFYSTITVATFSSLSFGSNLCLSSISLTGTTTTTFSFNRNRANGPVTVSGLTGTTQSITITDNEINSTGISILSPVLNAAMSITNNSNLNYAAGNGTTYTGAITIANNSVCNIGIPTGTRTINGLSIQNSAFYGIQSWNNIKNASITITDNCVIYTNTRIEMSVDDILNQSTISIKNTRIYGTSSSNRSSLFILPGSTLNLTSCDIHPISTITTFKDSTLNIGSSIIKQTTIDGIKGDFNYCDFTTTTFANYGTLGTAENNFINDYQDVNFVITDSSTSGSSIDNGGAPASLIFNSGDDGSVTTGYSDFLVPISVNGTISFDWSFTTTDDISASFAVFITDGFGGEIPIGTIDGGGLTQTGTITDYNVDINISFGFRVYTLNDGLYTGSLTISNFVFRPFAAAQIQLNNGLTIGTSVNIRPAFDKIAFLNSLVSTNSNLYLSTDQDAVGPSNITFTEATVKSSTLTISSAGIFDWTNTISENSTATLVTTNATFYNQCVSIVFKNSVVDFEFDQNIQINTTTFDNSVVHIHGTGSIYNVSNTGSVITGSVLENKDYSSTGKIGSFEYSNLFINSSRIGLENMDSQIVPVAMSYHMDNTNITGLHGDTLTGFSERVYVLPNETVDGYGELRLIKVTILNRKFIYSVLLVPGNGGNITTNDATSAFRDMIKQKISFSAAGNTLTSNNPGVAAVEAVWTDASFSPLISLNTPILVTTIDTSKYEESTTIVGPNSVPRSAIYFRIASGTITAGNILATFEGLLADATL